MHHHLPLKTGVSLAWQLSPRVSLTTGLTYAYLKSDFRDGGNSHYQKEQQQLQQGKTIPIQPPHRHKDIFQKITHCHTQPSTPPHHPSPAPGKTSRRTPHAPQHPPHTTYLPLHAPHLPPISAPQAQKKSPPTALTVEGLSLLKRQLPTLPHFCAVPSAQAGLTSLFGMGRGGTPPQ